MVLFSQYNYSDGVSMGIQTCLALNWNFFCLIEYPFLLLIVVKFLKYFFLTLALF